MRSQVVRYLGFVGLLIAPSSGIWAAEIYSFTSIDVPGATSGTGARGINNAGQIVGEFYASEPHGFLKDGVIFTTIDVPGTLGGQPFGINDAGRIVGTFFDARGNQGFLKDGATFTTIDVAGATGTQARGINDFARSRGASSMARGPRVSQGRRNFHDDRCSRRDRHRSLHLLKRDQRRWADRGGRLCCWRSEPTQLSRDTTSRTCVLAAVRLGAGGTNWVEANSSHHTQIAPRSMGRAENQTRPQLKGALAFLKSQGRAGESAYIRKSN